MSFECEVPTKDPKTSTAGMLQHKRMHQREQQMSCDGRKNADGSLLCCHRACAFRFSFP